MIKCNTCYKTAWAQHSSPAKYLQALPSKCSRLIAEMEGDVIYPIPQMTTSGKVSEPPQDEVSIRVDTTLGVQVSSL